MQHPCWFELKVFYIILRKGANNSERLRYNCASIYVLCDAFITFFILLLYYESCVQDPHTNNNKEISWQKSTHLVELLYSTDQVGITGRVLEVHIICRKMRENKREKNKLYESSILSTVLFLMAAMSGQQNDDNILVVPCHYSGIQAICFSTSVQTRID